MKTKFERALIIYGSQVMTAIFQYALKTERYEDCAIIKALFESIILTLIHQWKIIRHISGRWVYLAESRFQI